MTKPEPVLFLDDTRGIYIPRDFARLVNRECVTGIEPEDYVVLENPAHDLYWEVWEEVCDAAVMTLEIKYRLYQDGPLWLIPEGMEWDEKVEWFVWPESQGAS